MTVLPLCFDRILASLGHPGGVLVRDTSGRYEDGLWVETDPVVRAAPIQAVVLAASVAELELHAEGASSDGGIILHTKAELYFTDAGETGDCGRQSYVGYQGCWFRVAGTGLLLGNTRCNLYKAVRYLP